MKRENWIDACRFFAVSVIMVTHYLATFRPGALVLWERMPTWLLLGGLTGKLAVAFFFLVLGYFASAPHVFDPRGLIAYILRRYRQFAFFVFVTTLCYVVGCYAVTWLFHLAEGEVLRVISDGARYNLIYLLRDSFLLECSYNDTLWCMRQLFCASLVCWLLGCLPERFGTEAKLAAAAAVILCAALLGSRWVWLGTAALGFVLRLAPASKRMTERLSKPAVRWCLFAAAVVFIKAPIAEAEQPLLLYSMESIGVFLLLLVLFYTPWAKRLLASRPFPGLGRVSMGLFVVHTPINSLLASSVFAWLRLHASDGAAPVLCFPLSFALSLGAAHLLHLSYTALTRKKKTIKKTEL